MAKKKKHEGKNAQLVGETRLTQREMKKMQAAYHNIQRDNQTRLEEHTKAQIAAGMQDIGGIANLGMLP